DVCCSSRRRHTRSKRDWSSDVCSSDLATADRIPSPSAGTVRNSLCYGGQHGQMCPIAVWNAPGGRNALTTEVTPHGVLTRFPPRSEERRVGDEEEGK